MPVTLPTTTASAVATRSGSGEKRISAGGNGLGKRGGGDKVESGHEGHGNQQGSFHDASPQNTG